MVLWQSYKKDRKKNTLSIPQIIEKNAKKLQKQYLQWIMSLGNTCVKNKTVIEHLKIRAFLSYWWMTIPTLTSYKSGNCIYTAVRLLVLEKIIKSNKIRKVYVQTKNIAVIKILKKLGKKLKFSLITLNIPIKDQKKIHLNLLHKIKFTNIIKYTQDSFYFLKKFLRLNSMRCHINANHKFNSKNICLVDYFTNFSIADLFRGKLKSFFWTKLENKLNKTLAKKSFIHLYTRNYNTPNRHRAFYFFKKIKYKNNTFHFLMEDVLDISLLIKTIKDLICIIKSFLQLKRILEIPPPDSDLDLKPLFLNHWRNSFFGSEALKNLLMINCWDKILSILPVQKCGIYLMENQPWEAAFINAWKTSGHHLLIGVPHSSILDWDTRYLLSTWRFNENDHLKYPSPDIITANSPAMRKKMINNKNISPKIINVEALRYLYLSEWKKKNQCTIKHKKVCKVLVITDYDQKMAENQINMLKQAYCLISQTCKIVIKPHPACPNISNMPHDNMLHITHLPLKNLFRSCDIVFCGNLTSASIEAFECGLPVVTLLDGRYLNQSPLRGYKGVFFVRNPCELAKIINIIAKRGCSRRKHRDYFFKNTNIPNWGKLLKKVGIK